MSASPGVLGGVRGLLHSRQPIGVLGAYLYPQTFGLAKAHEAIDSTNQFVDSKNKERVSALAHEFILFSQKVN
jgi:chromate reductase, NAD(P)H dehydrogenase (quinone)